MNAQDFLQILREVKDVTFATTDENGRPRARIIDVMLVEEGRLYFCTARGKDFYRELTEGGYVAVTGMNRDFQMVRLEGKAWKVPEQKKWIDRIFEENPVMNDVYPGDSRYILEPFCLDGGQMEFFDLGKSPVQRWSFVLGEEAPREKGFLITEACIGCSKCSRSCPQKCIDRRTDCHEDRCKERREASGDSGAPYVIRQENCLHCGLCQENCPVSAVVRRGERAC